MVYQSYASSLIASLRNYLYNILSNKKFLQYLTDNKNVLTLQTALVHIKGVFDIVYQNYQATPKDSSPFIYIEKLSLAFIKSNKIFGKKESVLQSCLISKYMTYLCHQPRQSWCHMLMIVQLFNTQLRL